MPLIKFTEVLSYSSEDPNHPADNLLSQDTFRKWKCAPNNSDKQSFVILKLDHLTSINSVDIGNEGSALIEVLVSREGLADYQLLIVSSAFMTPQEVRNGTDLNRVRMFGPDKLNKNVASQKWDRLKVICTQPFNPKMQYGLSFVTARSNDSEGSAGKLTKLGSFTLKEEDDSDPIPIGSMFAKRNDKTVQQPLTGPAAIRAASKEAANSAAGTQKRKDPPADVGFYQLQKKTTTDQSPSTPNPKGPPARSKDQNEDRDNKGHGKGGARTEKNDGRPKVKEERSKNEKKEDKSKNKESKTPKKTDTPSTSKATTLDASKKKKKKSKPFNSLMDDVVFAMSGYQNPERGQLRDKLTDMGAQYKADWERTCTHLICAFTNTPKYRQVKGKGKIITAKWVTDCHKNKIRYPCRRYELDKRKDSPESEEEVWAEELLPKESKAAATASSPAAPAAASDTDEEVNFSDNEDTDDEIQKVLDRQQKTPKENANSKKSDSRKSGDEKESPKRGGNSKNSRVNGGAAPSSSLHDNSDDDGIYEDDTDVDEELPDTSSLPLPSLGDYFNGKHFFLYGRMAEEKQKLLNRYIVAFDGQLEDYMSEKVHFVISEDSWDENFEEALSDNPSIQFVKPQWIWRCCDKKKLVPHQPYLIVPKE